MTTSYPLTGDFNDLLGEEPRITGAWLETNLPAGTALVDLDANKVLLSGPKRITLDASNVFSISLIATNSTGTNVTDGTLRYRVRAQYSDGTGVPRTWESGFFDLTAAADLSDKVGGAGDLDVTIAPSASLIDAPMAANVTGPSQTRTALDAAYAPGGTAGTIDAATADTRADARIDARTPAPDGIIAGLSVTGDSTVRGTPSGDSEPGIPGTVGGADITVPIDGMSWLTWAANQSGGRLAKGRNAAIIGDTMAGIAARFSADSLTEDTSGFPIALCSGYNDAFADVSVASYMASVATIHGLARDARRELILCTPLPTANNAAISTRLTEYAAALRTYATAHGLFLLDLHALTLNSSTGHMIDSVKTDGDGVHPGVAGQVALGAIVAQALRPRLAQRGILPARDFGTLGNLTPNRTFTGAPTSGLAPNVFVSGSLPAGVTPTVETGNAFHIDGNWQRATHAASASSVKLAQRITHGGNIAAGDRIALTGYITTSGVAALLVPEFAVSPFGSAAISIPAGAAVTRQPFYKEFVVPASYSLGYVDIEMRSGPGTGYAEFAMLGVYNLSRGVRART